MKRLCTLLVLALCLCAGAAFGKTHQLALGVSVDVPDAWEVRLAVKQGAKVRLSSTDTEIFTADSAGRSFFAILFMRVRSGGRELAKSIQGGPNDVAAYYRNLRNTLREGCKKQNMELVAITDAELVTVGGYRSVLFRYVIKYPFNKSLSIVSVFTPVGDTVYDISFGHEFEKDVEGADIFLAILSSLAIEAKTGAPSATTAAKGRAPDVRSVLQKSGSPTPGDASAGKADTQTADTQAAKTDAPAAKADAQAAVEADNAELRAKMERLRQKARDMLS